MVINDAICSPVQTVPPIGDMRPIYGVYIHTILMYFMKCIISSFYPSPCMAQITRNSERPIQMIEVAKPFLPTLVYQDILVQWHKEVLHMTSWYTLPMKLPMTSWRMVVCLHGF